MNSKFAQDLKKATILLLLPITVAANSAAFAQQPASAPIATPAAAEAVQKAAQQSPIKYTELKLADTPDHTKLATDYPFLKDTIKEVQDSNKTGVFLAKTQIWTAQYKDAKTGGNLLFVSLNGSDYCGNQGCSLDVYTPGGQSIYSGLVSTPIFVGQSDKGASLLFCRDSGPEEWTMKGGTFVQSPVATPAAAKLCTAATFVPPAPGK